MKGPCVLMNSSCFIKSLSWLKLYSSAILLETVDCLACSKLPVEGPDYATCSLPLASRVGGRLFLPLRLGCD